MILIRDLLNEKKNFGVSAWNIKINLKMKLKNYRASNVDVIFLYDNFIFFFGIKNILCVKKGYRINKLWWFGIDEEKIVKKNCNFNKSKQSIKTHNLLQACNHNNCSNNVS